MFHHVNALYVLFRAKSAALNGCAKRPSHETDGIKQGRTELCGKTNIAVIPGLANASLPDIV